LTDLRKIHIDIVKNTKMSLDEMTEYDEKINLFFKNKINFKSYYLLPNSTVWYLCET
jgi:hypothetical protein